VNAKNDVDHTPLVGVETAHTSVDAVPEPHAPRWLLVAAGTLAAVTLLGAALAPALALKHPLWLIALTPWPRHLILVAPHTPTLPFIAVASVRGLLACVVAYELGHHYGPRGLAYLQKHSMRASRLLRALEELFGRWAPVLLMIIPGIGTSAFAGMSRVPRALAFGLSFTGLVAWAAVNRRLGTLLAPWTVPILRFVEDNMLLVTLLCSLAVLLYHLATRSSRKDVRDDDPPRE
jgi:membrane protein DedA with SNARE-associated domain